MTNFDEIVLRIVTAKFWGNGLTLSPEEVVILNGRLLGYETEILTLKLRLDGKITVVDGRLNDGS